MRNYSHTQDSRLQTDVSSNLHLPRIWSPKRCQQESQWNDSCHEYVVKIIDCRLLFHLDILQVHSLRKSAALSMMSCWLNIWQYVRGLKLDVKVLFVIRALYGSYLIRKNSRSFKLLNSLEVKDSLDRICECESIWWWIIICLKGKCLLLSQRNWIHFNKIIITLILVIANISRWFFFRIVTSATGRTFL
jgi:hypothetical protein